MQTLAPQVFHRDVYAPAPVFRSPGVVKLIYSKHSRKAAIEDRYGNLTSLLPVQINFDNVEIIEVEVSEGRIVKRVIRASTGYDVDLVLVVDSVGFVRTVWGNLTSDRHRSLNRSKYVQQNKS